MELLRRHYKVSVVRWRERSGLRLQKKGEKLYVQVTYLLVAEEIIKCEFGVLESIRDNFPKDVVFLDEIDHSRNGIKHQNIRDFLLAEHWG